jgi:uncharacterized OB-fold protein
MLGSDIWSTKDRGHNYLKFVYSSPWPHFFVPQNKPCFSIASNTIPQIFCCNFLDWSLLTPETSLLIFWYSLWEPRFSQCFAFCHVLIQWEDRSSTLHRCPRCGLFWHPKRMYFWPVFARNEWMKEVCLGTNRTITAMFLGWSILPSAASLTPSLVSSLSHNYVIRIYNSDAIVWAVFPYIDNKNSTVMLSVRNWWKQLYQDSYFTHLVFTLGDCISLNASPSGYYIAYHSKSEFDPFHLDA